MSEKTQTKPPEQPKTDYIERAGDARRSIMSVVYAMEQLADAFYLTGNEGLSERLSKWAGILHEASEEAQKCLVECMHKRYEESVRSSQNILMTAFAMAADTSEAKKAAMDFIERNTEGDKNE